MKINALDYVAGILVVVGGLNWGLVGALNFSLVAALFGTDSMLTKGVYILVGLAALYMIYTLYKLTKAPKATV